MNSQLHILLHVWNGLKLDADDFTALACAQGLPAAEQIKSLKSSRAREYFDCAPGWWTWSERQIELAHENGIGFCTILDADFPDGWRTLSTAPQVFTYIGRPIWKTRRLISVVGSRTPRGETCVWMQREFGEFLKNARDAGIVSGGARGVDQWAHRLSIDHDRPTLVVFPSGLLRRYPHNQDDLWGDVVRSGGCLLSTFPLAAEVRKSAFHIRNRWIAGLSPISFVVEANRRSGSALTATKALEEGRDVCTLPTFPLSHQGLGNLDLIACGALMIRDHKDLMTCFNSAKRS